MASGRQVEYSLKLNSNVSQVLTQADKDANKFENSMWQVQKTLASFGLGLGAHFLIDAAKEWTQAAADYETAMLRIRNASKEGFGLFNNDFVNNQVDKFKTKLQETSDAYGNFLFKIKNADLTNEVSNRLFENLSVVGKVGGIPQEQMDATVRNVGILLGEGVLEARHLRQLSYVHPQIVPFLADALGLKSGAGSELSKMLDKNIDDETAQQQLSQLISSGKLTKAALNSNVIIEAFEKYRLSIESKLPETLDLVQSRLNDLSNTWERFKISLTLGQKPELAEFFHSLENSIKWLSEHEESIIKIGKGILGIAEAYAIWRLSIASVNLVNGGVSGFFINEQQRLNSALSINTKNLSENAIANIELTQAQYQEVLSSEKQIVTNVEKETLMQSMKSTLSELNIQQELFTKSQLDNVASTELLKDEYIQLDMFSADAFRNFGLRSDGMQASLNKYKTSIIDTQGALFGLVQEEKLFIEQGQLFSDTVMMQQTALSGLTREEQLLNEQTLLRNNLLREQQILLEQQAGLASMAKGNNVLNPYKGIVSGLVSGAIMSVFIVGLTAEVASALVGKGKVSGKEFGFSDFIAASSQSINPGYWIDRMFGKHDSGRGLDKVIDINDENAQLKEFQERLNAVAGKKSKYVAWDNVNMKLIESQNSKTLDPKGEGLYNTLVEMQNELDKRGGINLLDYIDKQDQYGNRKKDNASLYNLITSKGFNIGSFLGTPEEDSGNSGKYDPSKIKIKGKDTTHIRGNSSNYFTIHIDKMIGMEAPVFKEVNDTTMKDVKAEIGVELTRIMLQVINDVQVVRNGH